MALEKQITYDNGTTASRHRIDGLPVRYQQGEGSEVASTLYSYLNANTRGSAARAPVTTTGITMGLFESQSNGNLREAMYTEIKSLPKWANAADC